jgi:hypothetical protein
MLKTFAIVFGIIMLVIGALGFVPEANPNGLLLGLFHVNFAHNLIHLATGLISLICGFASEYASRQFFKIFGVIYGLVAILGFYYGDRPIFGIIANNIPDAFLHVVIAVIALYLGFGYQNSTIISHDRNHNHDHH